MKLILDLALTSDIGLLIGDNFYSIKRTFYKYPDSNLIKPKEFFIPENDIINIIEQTIEKDDNIIHHPLIYENTECYIELPLFATTKQWSIFYGKVEQLLYSMSFKKIYRIDVSTWHQEAAKKLGYNSYEHFKSCLFIDQNYSSSEIMACINSPYYLHRSWFTKGFKESKILSMIYCLSRKLINPKLRNLPITEDEFDCRCIGDLVIPSMHNQIIKEEKSLEKKEKRKTILSKAKAIRIKQVNAKKDEIKFLKSKLKEIKSLVIKKSKKNSKKHIISYEISYSILLNELLTLINKK